jgi:hypothetical protein
MQPGMLEIGVAAVIVLLILEKVFAFLRKDDKAWELKEFSKVIAAQSVILERIAERLYQNECAHTRIENKINTLSDKWT